MIVVKLEMWPHGSEAKKYPLGEVRLTNVGGDERIGHYEVKLMKSAEYAKRQGPWRSGHVLNFHRLKMGPYDLLLRGLVACIGGHNVDDAEIVIAAEDEVLFSQPQSEMEIF